MKIKIIFINLFVFFLIFLTADLIFSNFVYKRNISHKCYEHDEDGKFYKLQKNCYAQMRLIETLDSFKLYTDKNGNRFSGSVTRSTNKNIYFIGDSIAFGLGVNWENSFAGIVESQKKNYNVTNLGVPGYSPSVYNYILQNLVKTKDIKGDKVFVVIDLTDVHDEVGRWRISKNKQKPYLISSINKKKKLSGFKKFKRENLKGLHLISTYIRDTGRSLRKLKKKELNIQYNEDWPASGTIQASFTYTNFNDLENCENEKKENKAWICGGVNSGLSKIEEKIINFGKLVKLNNAKFYIVILPWPETLNFGQNNFNWENYINNICKLSGCEKVINVFPEFKKIKNTREDWLKYLYLKRDIHLTNMGNKIVAEKILKNSF